MIKLHYPCTNDCVDCHFLGWYQQFETLAFLAHIQNYIIISSYSNLSTFNGLKESLQTCNVEFVNK